MNNDDTLWVLEHKIRRIDTDDSNGIVEITLPPHMHGPPPHFHS